VGSRQALQPQDGQTTHSGGSNYKGDGQSRSHQGDITHAQKNHNDEQMTDHDGTPSGKRRHVSGGSDSRVIDNHRGPGGSMR
jgi:hypothetical protein